jgi:pilus assembly protein Flp/PilA
MIFKLCSSEIQSHGPVISSFRQLYSVMFTGFLFVRSNVAIRVNRQEQGAMKKLLKHFLQDESGATAIEYGLIAAGISVAIITVVSSLGSSLNATFTSVQTALK